MTPVRWLFGALIAAQVGYARVPRRHRSAATRGVVLLMLATSAAEAVEARGGRRAAALLGSAGGIGFAAEQVGTRTGVPFGEYHYSGGLGPRVGGVPVLAAAAWAMMARPAWVTAGAIAGRPLHRAALAAGALTAWDVCLDPRMVRDGYWTWSRPGRYEDVPATNFAGWFVTALALFSLWAVIDRSERPRCDERAALSLYAWTWIGEAFASAFLWRRPRVAVAGGASMGAFAIPALVRDARCRRRITRFARR